MMICVVERYAPQSQSALSPPPGAGNVYPADAALSLPASRHSYTLARLAAQEAARGSFEAAHAAITGRCGSHSGSQIALARGRAVNLSVTARSALTVRGVDL